ncbi:hypothetical protein [Streptococcus ferus]|uniref:hypothetical protein n=1 Tax=Streptococcus ferus TaxID=1345 RepID=UPI003513D96C
MGKLEQEILSMSNELAECVQKKEFDEAWTIAGGLNQRLKGDQVIQLPASKLEAIKKLLRRYYAVNKEFNDISKKMYGIGKKLSEVVSG